MRKCAILVGHRSSRPLIACRSSPFPIACRLQRCYSDAIAIVTSYSSFITIFPFAESQASPLGRIVPAAFTPTAVFDADNLSEVFCFPDCSSPPLRRFSISMLSFLFSRAIWLLYAAADFHTLHMLFSLLMPKIVATPSLIFFAFATDAVSPLSLLMLSSA